MCIDRTSAARKLGHALTTLWFLVLSLDAAAGGIAQAQPDRFAAVKEIAARNQVALRQYTWVQTTQISVDGDVKATKVESCLYGPEGQLQKTVISAPEVKKEAGLRGVLQERKEAEIKSQLESAAVLVHSYVPPSPDELQAVVTAGNMQMLTAAPGQAILAFKNYQLPGDALSLTFNLEPRGIATVDVSTWLEAPSKPVTLVVQFQTLPDGTNYAALSTLTMPSSNIQVTINNSDYQKTAM